MLSGMIGLGKVGLCTWLRVVGLTYRPWMIVFCAILSSFATLIESQAKVSEMSLYVLPRFLDAVWSFFQRRGLAYSLPGGRTMIFSIAIAVIGYCHEHEVSSMQPTLLKGYYQTLCKQLLG